MIPVGVYDTLQFERESAGITLSCSDPELPVDASNLVHRAAALFFERAKIKQGVEIRLDKRVPVGGGLGGGSANAAVTLLALNELYGNPLAELSEVASQLGSDVPFFLQLCPALATGRGEKIEPLNFFPALKDKWFLLVYPGFGVPTAWAYKNLQPPYGKPRKAAELIRSLSHGIDSSLFSNSLELPVLRKYPLLQLFQEFLRDNGALVAMMSGSGSTTFAICDGESEARELERKTQEEFGPLWTAAVQAEL